MNFFIGRKTFVLFTQFTYEKEVADKQDKLSQAKNKLERVKSENASQMAQKEADLATELGFDAEVIARALKIQLGATALRIPLRFTTALRVCLGGDFGASITRYRRARDSATEAAQAGNDAVRHAVHLSKSTSRRYLVINCSCVSTCSGSSGMQSTGHTGTHSSQPVQTGSITVCITLLLPRIASVGQTSMVSGAQVCDSVFACIRWVGKASARGADFTVRLPDAPVRTRAQVAEARGNSHFPGPARRLAGVAQLYDAPAVLHPFRGPICATYEPFSG